MNVYLAATGLRPTRQHHLYWCQADQRTPVTVLEPAVDRPHLYLLTFNQAQRISRINMAAAFRKVCARDERDRLRTLQRHGLGPRRLGRAQRAAKPLNPRVHLGELPF